MLSIKDAARTFIDLSCYAGPGLSTIGYGYPESVSDMVYGAAMNNAGKLLRDLCFFDRCYLVVGDYSELLGLNFYLRGALLPLLESGHLKLIRLPYFPVFIPNSIDEPEQYRGIVMGGIPRYAGTDDVEPMLKDPEWLYDNMMDMFSVPGNFDQSMRNAKQAALDNTIELRPKYGPLGATAIQEICTHFNNSKRVPTPLEPAQFTAYLTSELHKQNITRLAPSHYTYRRTDWPASAAAFECQFLFNLSIEIARMCDATDFQAADPICMEVKLSTLSQSGDAFEPARQTCEGHNDPFHLMNLSGVPDIASSLRSDPEKSTRFVDSVCSERGEDFRKWYHENAGSDPNQIVGAYIRLLSHSSLAEQTSGKLLRYLVAGAGGFIPFVGPALGLTLSAVDSFLLDKLVSPKKPKVFIEELKQVLT